MIVYVDLVFILNFSFDFLLLLTVNIVLKRNVKLIKIFLGALFGSLSIFFLFLELNSLELFLLKIIISIIMTYIAFDFKTLKYTINNLTYLYMISTILGGFLYYLNLEFSSSNNGLIFAYNGLSMNYIFLLIISPIILYIYIKQTKEFNTKYNYYYQVYIEINEKKKIKVNGYLDTGNKLFDPITNKKIIILNKDLIRIKYPLYVVINGVNNQTLLKCMKINYIEINKIKFKNYLIGVMDNNINIDGIDCILHSSMLNKLG